jgi:hypothetical protein
LALQAQDFIAGKGGLKVGLLQHLCLRLLPSAAFLVLCAAACVLQVQASRSLQQGSRGIPEALNACGFTTKSALLLALQAQGSIAGKGGHLALQLCLYVESCDQLEERWAED